MFTSLAGLYPLAVERSLYFAARQHAGDNVMEMLKRRASELLAPIKICHALSRDGGMEVLLEPIGLHSRLNMLGHVYGYYTQARERELTLQANECGRFQLSDMTSALQQRVASIIVPRPFPNPPFIGGSVKLFV